MPGGAPAGGAREEEAMHPSHFSKSGAGRVRFFAVTAFGAAAVVAGVGPGVALAVGSAVENPGNGHWYRYVESGGDWSSCRNAATLAGGYLATITSPDEYAWIVQNLGISGKPAAWIGGTDSAYEGTWAWVDGENWTFANWAEGEPSDTSGLENWVAMASNGKWSDESATQVMAGYIVEWDTQPAEEPPIPAPTAPTGLVAVYSQGAGVALTWNDNSADEAGFVVERMPAGLSWSARHTLDADAEAWTDFALFPAKTYTYRVAAIGAGGVSEYSNEVSITTSAAEAVPAPPSAPSALAATVTGPSSVDVTWSDNSGDETLFDLERAAGGAGFAKMPSRPADSVSFTDETVHPGWPYAYRIRALGLQGPSAFSTVASVTVPPTLTLSVSSGTLTRSEKTGRDAIRVAASFADLAGSLVPALDPVAEGLDLQLGPVSAPVLVSIGAGDPAWKLMTRHGEVVKATWKSRKGVSPKVAVTLDLVRGTVKVTASGASFAQDASANVRVLFACGGNCGAATSAWTQRKPNVLKFQ
jgi:hypothetical protein